MSQQKPLVRADSNKGGSSDDEQVVLDLHYKTAACSSPTEFTAIEQYHGSKQFSRQTSDENDNVAPSNQE